MPYIIIARDDLPDGLLQVQDLKPNRSQRNFPYQKVAQTGYLRNIPNETGTTITAGVIDDTIKGLTAYLLGQVSSGAGAKATASITTVAVASLVDGDFFEISDGENSEEFEFVVTATYGVTSGRTPIDVSALVTANDVRDAIVTAITASETLNVTAASGGAATVSLTNDNQNQATATQDAANSENVANVGFAITSFVGAADSDPLTVSEATVDATDITDLVAAGSALTRSALNTALTTGNLNWNQVAEVLDILAGKEFILEAGTDIGTVEFAPGGGFNDDDLPNPTVFYDTGEFKASWRSGQLSLLRDSGFTYLGAAGAAVSVYDNDGAVYTG